MEIWERGPCQSHDYSTVCVACSCSSVSPYMVVLVSDLFSAIVLYGISYGQLVLLVCSNWSFVFHCLVSSVSRVFRTGSVWHAGALIIFVLCYCIQQL